MLAAPVPGVSWVDCPVCGTRAHIEAPLLVLRPGASAPLLLAVSVAELGGGPPPSGEPLLAEAERAGAFLGGAFHGEAIPLPRRLLPHVLARDLERDLADPESACRELEPEGAPTVANYRIFLEYLGKARADSLVEELLSAMLLGLPDALAELVRTHPELREGTRVRDAGREELRGAAETPLKEVLRMRQRLLDELCDGRTTPDTAIRRYFESLGRFDAGLRTRLHAMYLEARDTDGPEGIPLAREALELASGLGEEDMETELAARLGERLVLAVHAGLDADPSEAVRVLERALSRLGEGTLPWVEVANNLASAHHLRDDGDRSEIWEAARDLLARATALDRGEYPEYWARVQTNYGLLLSERPGGGPEDLTLGIEHIRAGLEERSPERDRVAWAYSMVNLGLLLYRRAGAVDLREAEQCYRDALSHLGAGDDPALWSRIQCNLGDLLLSRDPVDARGAREAATAALALSTARPGLLDTGRIAWLLARAMDHIDGPGSADGLRLRRAALAATPATVSPSLHLNIGRELLRAHATAERWSEAADVASGMLTAVTALYDAQVTGTGRRSVLAEVNRIARWAAFLLARAGRLERAVEAIEGGVACELSVVAGRGAADLEALERIDPAAAHRYRLAQARYRSAVGEASGGPAGAGATVSGEAAAERGVRAAITEIRAIPGFERFLRTDGLADIVRAAGGRPLIYLVNAPWGSYALVLPRSPGKSPAVRAVPVPEVSSETITGLLVLDPADGALGLLLAQEAGALRRRRLLPQALDRLAALGPLLRPVAEILAEDPEQEAVVVPTGLLGLVPLHAVPLGPGAQKVLDDIGTVILSPSAAVYASSRLATNRPPEPVARLVGVTDPDGSLPGGRGELAQIRKLFEPHGEAHCAVGPEATVDWLLGRLAEASYLHIICHGSGEFDGRGASLALADGRLDMDTLAQHRLPACRLAVASACQSGHYEVVRAPDEFRGLAAGFLQAGAACAVTGLWLVDDMVTAVLMARFYELLVPAHGPGGLPPVAALHRARTWLRRLTWEELARYTASRPHLAALTERYTSRATTGERPFASPVHWAAFTAWGV
ncbi:CHAT domain-containing protein [Streptomyces lavendulae]|uniref:CHAT domain-containing protein n=1 Tax=Streptomyces lavendulae TaxID=1914 RepID=UPI002553F4A2|nr:CHAT domain-containing protein [Streptomyces lavendulae]